jgi:hypothetical protein
MSNTEHPIHFKRPQLEESASFDRSTLDYIHRASSTGLYEIRGLGAKRKLPHFDDLVFLTASLSRYPLEGYREKCSTKTVLGTRFAKKPVVLDTPITIAGMSFGALSANVKEALGKAATAMGTSTTTGDGGMTSEERLSSKTLVYQCLPSRYGFKIVIKHVPDQSFAIQERLYRQLEHHFANELELWGTDDTARLAIIATFSVTHTGLPCIDTLSLMALSSEWIPIASGYDAHLVRTLVHGQRSFIKTQRYNQRETTEVASAVLTDTGEAVIMAPIAQQTLA